MNSLQKLTLIFLSALGLRIFLLPYWTHTSDMNLWVYWGQEVVRSGFDTFFEQVSWTDYLPFYFYILYFLAKIQPYVQFISSESLYKLPALLADFITAIYLYKILAKRNKNMGVWAATLYIFNPAVFFNSTLWGQVDGIGGMLLAFITYYFLARKYIITGIFLAIALTFKPLFIVALPVLGIILLLESRKITNILSLGISSAITIWLIVFPFVATKIINGNFIAPFQLLFARYQASIGQYPYTSVNAFNFWSVGGRWWLSDQTIFYGISFDFWGKIILFLFITTITIYLIRFWKKSDRQHLLVVSLFVVFLALYTFATRAHERHMFPIFPFLALLAAESLPYLIIYFVLSVSYFSNLYFALFWLFEDGEYPFEWSVINIFSLINTFIPIAFLITFLCSIVSKKDYISSVFSKSLKSLSFLKAGLVDEKTEKRTNNLFFNKWVLLVFILLSVLRIWRFELPNTYYFDEVYHAYTAQEVVNHNPKAWEFLATPPKGFAYEWTHPPMSKLIMAGGMILLGSTDPWAWRVTGLIFGFGCLALVYLLTNLIFKRQLIAIWATLLFMFDGMSIVMSRIGMNDIYFLFFVLATIYLFLKDRYLFSSICLGLALSSKWTTFYLFPILAIAAFLYKREMKFQYLFFLILPPIIYIASYFVFFATGHSFLNWWETQQQMWWYHTGLRATHPYSSPWWSWPFMGKPVWLYVSNEGNSVINLYIAGNPVIFYGSIAAVIFSLVSLFKGIRKNVFLILICYLGFFLPWALSPRIMFLYHYFPSVPFMIIILSWFLYKLWENGNKIIVIGYWALVVIGFICYYPLWTGFPTPSWYPGYFF